MTQAFTTLSAVPHTGLQQRNARTLLHSINEVNVPHLWEYLEINGLTIDNLPRYTDIDTAVKVHDEFADKIRTSVNHYAEKLYGSVKFDTTAYDAFNKVIEQNGSLSRLYNELNRKLGNNSNCQTSFELQLKDLAKLKESSHFVEPRERDAARRHQQEIDSENTKYLKARTLLQNINAFTVMNLCRDSNIHDISIETLRGHVLRNDPEKAVAFHFEFMDRVRTSITSYAKYLLVINDYDVFMEEYDAFKEALLENGCMFRLYKDVNDYLGNHSNCHDLFSLQRMELEATRWELLHKCTLT